MICPFILLAMISFASAQPSMSDIAKTCRSKTAIIDGHLHMTSIVGARQKQECSINLQETNRHVFLEFERYGGRKPDAKACALFEPRLLPFQQSMQAEGFRGPLRDCSIPPCLFCSSGYRVRRGANIRLRLRSGRS